MKKKIISVLTSCALIMALPAVSYAADPEEPMEEKAVEEEVLEIAEEKVTEEVPTVEAKVEAEAETEAETEGLVEQEEEIVEEPIVISVSVEEQAPVLMATSPENSDEPVPPGYTSDEHELSAWNQSGKGYNIMNKVDGKWRETTYHGFGYLTTIRMDGEFIDLYAPVGEENDLGNGLFVTVTPKFSEDGKYISPVYTIRNDGERDVIFDLAASADIQIGNNDYAPIEVFESGQGFKMMDPKTGVQFNFFGKNVSGVTDVDAFWIGSFYDLGNDVIFTQTDLKSLTRTDSAMAYSWHGITLSPHGSIEKKVLLGNGEIGSEKEVLEPEKIEPEKIEPVEEEVKAEPEVVEEAEPVKMVAVHTENKVEPVVPKTGDSNDWGNQVILLISAIAALTIIQYRRTKREI